MALLNDYLLKDLDLFDFNTFSRDIQCCDEVTFPQMHYFAVIGKIILTIRKYYSQYRLWSVSWKPKVLVSENGKPMPLYYYPKGDKYLLCATDDFFKVKRYFGFYLNQIYQDFRDQMFGGSVVPESSEQLLLDVE